MGGLVLYPTSGASAGKTQRLEWLDNWGRNQLELPYWLIWWLLLAISLDPSWTVDRALWSGLAWASSQYGGWVLREWGAWLFYLALEVTYYLFLCTLLVKIAQASPDHKACCKDQKEGSITVPLAVLRSPCCKRSTLGVLVFSFKFLPILVLCYNLSMYLLI